ncbi:MAG: HD-GYP domain-containing protein [Nitrospirae bacterium]|nr:HD-GYP domain-containing protein [Nitrospirota bacterium]
MLSRLAVYIVILAWFILGLYILSITDSRLFASGVVRYFLSTEESGIKFRALSLLAPFVLTVIGYLVNERAKLAEKTFLAEKRLRSLFDELIVAFANALDAKSPWTKGHSERVTSYALSIAGAMHVGKTDLETLKIASLLHDIGKLGTYDVILDKAGPLTEDEWKLVMMHPGKGAEILGPITDFDRIIPIIRGHHERVDGKGYPDGLKGEEIPLLAKILCLADSFDAMTAERPYKTAMSKEDAVSQIRQKAGTQFDREVVGVFLSVVGGSEDARRADDYVLEKAGV